MVRWSGDKVERPSLEGVHFLSRPRLNLDHKRHDVKCVTEHCSVAEKQEAGDCSDNSHKTRHDSRTRLMYLLRVALPIQDISKDPFVTL